jgi:hypothetical protein
MNEIKNTQRIENKDFNYIYLLPIMLIIAIVPLIVFAKEVTLTNLEIINWKGEEIAYDFNSYYKSIFFVILSFVSVFTLGILSYFKKIRIKKSKYYIPLAVYIVFTFISFIMSENIMVSSRGFIEQFQGVWVLIGYGLIIFSIINFIKNEEQIKILVGAYIFSAFIVGLIGITQYFGFDFFKTIAGMHLILPKDLHYLAEKMSFIFSKNTIYATMYNTNFVGSFAAMLVPLSIFIYLYSKERVLKIGSFVFSLLMLFVWVGCNSRAGYVGLFFGFILTLILFAKNIRKNKRKIIVLFIAFLIMISFMNISSNGRVFNQFSRVNPIKEGERLEEIRENELNFEDITFGKDFVFIKTNDRSVKIVVDENNNLNFYNENEEEIKTYKTIFDDIVPVKEEYKEYSIKNNLKNNHIVVNAYDKDLKIYKTNEGLRIEGVGKQLVDAQYPKYLKMFEGRERFASSRGYIWSRSIPMLKETLLVGYGPGMYTPNFPNFDYVGKLNAFPTHKTIIDKPHNMYLQIGLETGIISLLALLSIYAMYFIDSFKIYFKRDINTFLEHIGIACVIGVMSYLFAGLFNDQIISVAPLFYVILGIGLSVNKIIRN